MDNVEKMFLELAREARLKCPGKALEDAKAHFASKGYCLEGGAPQMDLFESQTSLEDSKRAFEADIDADGEAVCDTCGRKTKVYRRKLNSSMARGLVWIVNQSVTWEKKKVQEIDWVNVQKDAPREFVKSFQLGTLKHWGLVEQKKNSDKSKRTSGVWRPTHQGVLFVVHPWIEVRSHAVIRNGFLEKLDGDLVGIEKSLGEHFDYEELMRGGGYGT